MASAEGPEKAAAELLPLSARFDDVEDAHDDEEEGGDLLEVSLRFAPLRTHNSFCKLCSNGHIHFKSLGEGSDILLFCAADADGKAAVHKTSRYLHLDAPAGVQRVSHMRSRRGLPTLLPPSLNPDRKPLRSRVHTASSLPICWLSCKSQSMQQHLGRSSTKCTWPVGLMLRPSDSSTATFTKACLHKNKSKQAFTSQPTDQ